MRWSTISLLVCAVLVSANSITVKGSYSPVKNFFIQVWSIMNTFKFLWLGFAFLFRVVESYLDLRQIKCTKVKTVPRELSSFIDSETFRKAQAYSYDKLIMGLVVQWVEFFGDVFTVLYLMPYIWKNSGKALGHRDSEYLRTLCFLTALNIFSKVIEVPVGLYKDFVVEQRHGFNKKTLGLFFMDLIKAEVLSVAVLALLLYPLLWIVRYSGPRFAVYVWVFAQVMIVLFMYIFPVLIQPLFNKVEPLKDEELRKKIEALAVKNRFPLKKLYQMDGSKRSVHSSAYFYGFGSNKQIVLFDTLLKMPHSEILAVLSHEIGHWFHNHMLQGLALTSANIFLVMNLYSWFITSRSGPKLLFEFGFSLSPKSWGNQRDIAFVIGVTLFLKLYGPISVITKLLVTIRSRKNEFQADRFAVDDGQAKELASALKNLQKENLGNMVPDSLYSWYHYSHPPVVERLRAIELAAKKVE